MMYKKFICAVAITSVFLVSCGGSPNPTPSPTPDTSPASTITESPTTTPNSPDVTLQPTTTPTTPTVSPTAGNVASDEGFTLVNKTGGPIHSVYVAPIDSAEFVENLLTKDSIANDESIKIKLDTSKNTETWDIAITDGPEDGKETKTIVYSSVTLSKGSEVTLTYDDDEPKAEVK